MKRHQAYTHPATGRLNELTRKGWTIIATNVSLDAMRKAGAYPEGTVWLTTGDVLAPPAKQKQEVA